MPLKSVKIASRKSDLARIQALTFGKKLKEAHPQLDVQFHFRESLGDKNLNDPLWKMPERGVFTEDFYEDLVQGRFDMVVHSWKDLPTEPREHTTIAATLEREDMRDLLLVKKSHLKSVSKSRKLNIYSSSPRRAFNLTPFLKWAYPLGLDEVVFESVRGNMQTRIHKLLENDDIDALIVAKAAIDRLLSFDDPEFVGMQEDLKKCLSQLEWMVLPLSVNPCAAAQGALAVEVCKEREDIIDLLKTVNCEETMSAVSKERKLLSSFGGGCHQKIGASVLKRGFGEILFLRGETEAGEFLNKNEIHREEKFESAESEELFSLKDHKLFSREVLADITIEKKALWVARANALPEDYLPSDQVVWCAGLKSWERLAARGLWVNGCAEGLGEKEDERLDELAGPVEWLKLTHEKGIGENKLATYKLVPEELNLDLKGKSHFYWMSYSQFEHITNKYPDVKDKNHACGPGLTFEKIKEALGAKGKIEIFLNFDHWKEKVVKK